jgi:hypothetical protein
VEVRLLPEASWQSSDIPENTVIVPRHVLRSKRDIDELVIELAADGHVVRYQRSSIPRSRCQLTLNNNLSNLTRYHPLPNGSGAIDLVPLAS